MKFTKVITTMVAVSAMSTSAFAAVTAEETKQLGTTLTPWGMIKAGNKDGSIPEWKPLKTPPANYKAGSGFYVDPYPDEKPILVIDAKNMDAHTEKLPESAKMLMKRFPSFHINVYPGHRNEWFTKEYEEGSIKNATRGKLTADGLGIENSWGGTPFPIPKNGSEVMWNVQLRNMPTYLDFGNVAYLYDTSNRASLLSGNICHWITLFNDASLEGTKTQAEGYGLKRHCQTTSPARSAGEQSLSWFSLDPANRPQRNWTYMVGQRRVRLAPEFSYDTPVAPYGGALNYDEIGGFSGKLDRFNWKLVGQKEMYIPANNYKISSMDPKNLASTTAGVPNMDAIRFELRRVWIVEATRRPDARHSSKTRRFYVDEGNWIAKWIDASDDSGKFSRATMSDGMFLYDLGGFSLGFTLVMDLNKGQFLTTGFDTDKVGIKSVPLRKQQLIPEYMGSSGVR